MKYIYTKAREQIIVDDDDYDLLSSYKWSMANGYAQTVFKENKKYVFKTMHRMLLNAQPGEICDHANRMRNDNRRSNLRIVTRSQNNINRYIPNKTGYKGVNHDTKNRKNPWWAMIKVNGKRHYLGAFPTAELAANAYDEAALKFYGDHAYLNNS